ncbi:DMT family transporter [Tumebacillus flagellatus]|uniref:Multidrug transporter n=1 Tax=Tumebacillus flagellatus TaxID=1157490 RepID=A0A074LMH5_9BACL|nr:DMT family transporter [Tumebacillus flagellatus]KEO82329.1 multidrug transporter [Tumebacillus flagellatus]
MKPLKADLVMLFVTLCWGSSYLLMKIGLESISAFQLIALRFGIAFVLAAILFFRHLFRTMNVKTLLYSFCLGLLLFAVLTCITVGLKTTTTSKAGFLQSLTVVFVPLIGAFLLKSKITPKTILSVLIAIMGIGCLTIEFPLTVSIGDLWCMASALFYAIHILLASNVSKKVDTLSLGIMQIGFTGLLGFMFSLLFETPAWPTSTTAWFAILMLSVFCSLGFVVQVIVSKYTSANRTGLIFSLEPVFAAIFGVLFAHEVLGGMGTIGAALVLLSIVLTTGNLRINLFRKAVRKRNNLSPVESRTKVVV